MKKSPKSRGITPKSLGLVDDVKLSETYANSRTNFKTVSDIIIGYYVAGDGVRVPVRIAPVYRADIWFRGGKVNTLITSHEIGDYYNPQRPDGEEPDVDGDALARIAATALSALQRHADYERAKRERTKRAAVATSTLRGSRSSFTPRQISAAIKRAKHGK